MKLTFVAVILCLSCLFSHSQSFEGQIIYQNTYKSKLSNLNDQQLASMMGNMQTYYIKGGDYKSEMNGTFMQWQLYINTDNKLYSKFSNSQSVFWNDGAINTDSVMSSEYHPAVTEILGYKCDELVLNCKSGVQKYYFNARLGIDSKLYAKHQYSNWYIYLTKAHAVPLKIIVESTQFRVEEIATSIKPMTLDKKMFTLPAGVKTEKSPY